MDVAMFLLWTYTVVVVFIVIAFAVEHFRGGKK